MMVVLAIETVTPQGSVAVWRDGVSTVSVGDGRTPQAVRLPSAWMSALGDAGLGLDDVDRLAVTSGPGSFTGARIGMASAQGLALTRGWTVTAIPTLDAMAACWCGARQGSEACTVVACLDGLRGEVFVREFHFDGAVAQPLGEPLVTTPDQVRWTPHPGGVAFVGSGAARYASQWTGVSRDVADVPEPIAAGTARLAARGDWPAVAPHALRPVYVRRPYVEVARERGHSSAG